MSLFLLWYLCIFHHNQHSTGYIYVHIIKCVLVGCCISKKKYAHEDVFCCELYKADINNNMARVVNIATKLIGREQNQ